jgi:hypothetical protein
VGIQPHAGLCVRLATLNRYSLVGREGEVSDGDARHADRIQAATITGAAAVSAAVTTVALLRLVG